MSSRSAIVTCPAPRCSEELGKVRGINSGGTVVQATLVCKCGGVIKDQYHPRPAH